MKRPFENVAEYEVEKQRKMRTLARAKADRMSKPASSASLAQTLDQISEEEREEILKYVEQEQTQVKLQKSKNTDWYQLSFYIIKVLSF